MGFWARFRSSLTYPIAATLVLVTVVPVALVGYSLASINREHLTTVEKQYLTRQAVSLASEVSLFFAGHRTQLRSTVRALAIGEPLATPEREILLQRMAAEPDRSFIYLQILDRNGNGTFVRSPQLTPAEVDELSQLARTTHEAALAAGEVEVLHSRRAAGAAEVRVIALPILTPSGEVWGTLVGVLDLTPLERRIADTTYAGLVVSLIDEKGRVTASSNPALRGRDLTLSPLVQDFVRNPMRLTRTYPHPFPSTAGEVLGSIAPVPGLGWGVVVERPTADAFAPVRAMQRRTVVVTALAALVALALGLGMSRRLTSRIQELAAVSWQIADGNLAVRSEAHGTDEIAQLAANFNHMSGSIEALVRRLKQALRQNQELFLETIRTLAAAIDAKDPYTRGHSERVSSYSMAISRHLGLSPEEVFRIRIAAILHDVGKLGVRDSILNKPGGLSEDEYRIMRRHPDIGAQIMAPIRMLKDIIPGIRNHHEAWDGTGYPDGLKGEGIPLVARIIGASDTFDAMTTNRPYQQAMALEFVIGKMRAMSGVRYDPDVINALLAAIEAGDVTPPAIHAVEQSGPQWEAS